MKELSLVVPIMLHGNLFYSQFKQGSFLLLPTYEKLFQIIETTVNNSIYCFFDISTNICHRKPLGII